MKKRLNVSAPGESNFGRPFLYNCPDQITLTTKRNMNFLFEVCGGLIDLPWWGYVLVGLGFTHVTIAAVTIFLHRYQAHRALELHPAISHFFRFWLWLTTGMVTKEWAAVHRKHHAKCETEEDPHSPQIFGLRKVLLEGAELYRIGSSNAETLAKYGHGTPDDWMERNVYSRHSVMGISIMMVINLVLFGFAGLAIWALQMAWIPIFAAGVINGLGHHTGYRNFQPEDASTNIVPWGILIGGEELHNNHHAYATSARLSSQMVRVRHRWIHSLQSCPVGRGEEAGTEDPLRDGQARRSAHPASRDHAPLRRGATLRTLKTTLAEMLG
jgi:fatty-acid desaturase